MNAGAEPSGGLRLIGWKRIAAHLGCSERTARRWEQEEDLPVHRQQHESRSTVYAVPSELDAWVASRSQMATGGTPPRVPTRFAIGWIPFVASIAILVAVASVAIVALIPDRGTSEASNTALTEDAVALDLYERGRALWLQRGEVPIERAIKLLTEAVERDPEFAQAWSALASAWLTYPTYSDEVTAQRGIEEALLAADRAVRIDASLAEPRVVMATIAQRRSDWIGSERVYQEALEADPENPTLMIWFASHYRELGMMQEAEKLTSAALTREPNSPPNLTESSMNNYQMGRIEDSRSGLDYLWFDLGFEVPIVWTGRWLLLTETGEYDAALAWIEESPFPAHAALLAEFVARKQNPDYSTSEAFISRIKAGYEAGFPAWLAYHTLDQSNLQAAALDILEADSQNGEFLNSVVLYFPRGGMTWKDDRFADLVERLGHVEYWRARGAPDICRLDPDVAVCRRVMDGN